MPSSDLDHLLDRSAHQPETPLPSGFSDLVLHRARQVRDFSRRHRKLLAGVSSVALAIALIVALFTTSSVNSDSPPSLMLFQPGDPAQPFVTE